MSAKRLKAFGRKVREIRKEQGLSQEALAARAGLDRSYMGHIERGEKNVTLTKITPSDLPAHRKDDPHPDTQGGLFRDLWNLPSKLNVHIKAGSRLYVGGPGVVEAIETTSQKPEVV